MTDHTRKFPNDTSQEQRKRPRAGLHALYQPTRLVESNNSLSITRIRSEWAVYCLWMTSTIESLASAPPQAQALGGQGMEYGCLSSSRGLKDEASSSSLNGPLTSPSRTLGSRRVSNSSLFYSYSPPGPRNTAESGASTFPSRSRS